MTSVKPAGRDTLGEDLHEKVGLDTVNAERMVNKPTGPEEVAQSGFDQMPYKYDVGTDPRLDTAFRDTVSLTKQGIFGEDGLAGVRPYDPAIVGYLQKKRGQVIKHRFHELAMKCYDPLEPAQRARLEALVPQLNSAKTSAFEEYQEQNAFIMRCIQFLDISPQEWERLVLIIGGGELLREHPLQAYTAPSDDPAAAIAAAVSWARKSIPGLWSFLDPPQKDGTNRSAEKTTKEQRNSIARATLHHFPRMLTGAYNELKDADRIRAKPLKAAEKVREACEAIVAEMIPLGNFAHKYMEEVETSKKAKRLGSDQLQTYFTAA